MHIRRTRHRATIESSVSLVARTILRHPQAIKLEEDSREDCLARLIIRSEILLSGVIGDSESFTIRNRSRLRYSPLDLTVVTNHFRK